MVLWPIRRFFSVYFMLTAASFFSLSFFAAARRHPAMLRSRLAPRARFLPPFFPRRHRGASLSKQGSQPLFPSFFSFGDADSRVACAPIKGSVGAPLPLFPPVDVMKRVQKESLFFSSGRWVHHLSLPSRIPSLPSSGREEGCYAPLSFSPPLLDIRDPAKSSVDDVLASLFRCRHNHGRRADSPH